MSLSPLWDFVFGAALLGKGFWYFSERPMEKGVSRIRVFSFYSGLILAFLVLVGPIAHIAVNKFQFHMIQHISLMMLISPLIVLGSPIKVAVDSKYLFIRNLVHNLGSNFLIKQLLSWAE